MLDLNRRSLIFALSALPIAACAPDLIRLAPDSRLGENLDMSGIKAIANSYLKSTQDPMKKSSLKPLFKKAEINLEAVQLAVKQDYQARRVFIHNGWFLSHTEGKLFALLSQNPQTKTP